jgi:hypothetical protein|tara:strand:+ start:231 stop:818 length:588 start_codon:yes stop_codon:yes gene_type:complete
MAYNQFSTDVYIDGKLGVGTTAPTAELGVIGGATFSSSVTIDGTVDTAKGGTASVYIRLEEASAKPRIRMFGGTQATLRHDAGSGNGSIIDLDPIPASGYDAQFRFFRATNTTGDTKLRIFPGNNSGSIMVDVNAKTGDVDIAGDFQAAGNLILSASAPASSTAAGIAGTITYDSSYIYICTATNVWERVAVSTW